MLVTTPLAVGKAPSRVPNAALYCVAKSSALVKISSFEAPLMAYPEHVVKS